MAKLGHKTMHFGTLVLHGEVVFETKGKRQPVVRFWFIYSYIPVSVNDSVPSYFPKSLSRHLDNWKSN